MLCSDDSARKSSSKWLDRLRSSKGFPSGDGDDLEQFITHQGPNMTESNPIPVDGSGPIQTVQASEASNQTGDESLFNVMSNVLSELFVMGGRSNVHAKKSSRKQPNPKICSNDRNGPENTRRTGQRALSPMSDGNSRAGTRELSDQGNEVEDRKALTGDDDDEEETTRDLNLPGFSRTEVTVIDTSCVSWKFEKLLFRKKNVWKVRDKKSKTVNFGRKKKQRKADTFGMSEDVNGKKKHKVLDGQRGDSEEGDVGDCELPLPNEEAYHENETLEEASRRTLNYVCADHESKHLGSKLEKGGSSVILIKSIPTSKKNGASTSRYPAKPVPKRQRAL